MDHRDFLAGIFEHNLADKKSDEQISDNVILLTPKRKPPDIMTGGDRFTTGLFFKPKTGGGDEAA